MTCTLYVGGAREGIGRVSKLELDDAGALHERASTDVGVLASFLLAGQDILHVADEFGHQLFRLDPATLMVRHSTPTAGGPVYLSRAGGLLLVAHYEEGLIEWMEWDGISLGRATAGHQAHAIVPAPDGAHAFVPLKGEDAILRLRIHPERRGFPAAQAASREGTPGSAHAAAALEALDRIPVSSGAGPRHLRFHPTLPMAYLVGELDHVLRVYEWKSGMLHERQALPLLPANAEPSEATSAGVHLSPDGRFVYATNRYPKADGDIAIFRVRPDELVPCGHAPSGGRAPRSFALSPEGRWLVVANRFSGELVVFERDDATGALRWVQGLPFPEPTHVVFAAAAPGGASTRVAV